MQATEERFFLSFIKALQSLLYTEPYSWAPLHLFTDAYGSHPFVQHIFVVMSENTSATACHDPTCMSVFSVPCQQPPFRDCIECCMDCISHTIGLMLTLIPLEITYCVSRRWYFSCLAKMLLPWKWNTVAAVSFTSIDSIEGTEIIQIWFHSELK